VRSQGQKTVFFRYPAHSLQWVLLQTTGTDGKRIHSEGVPFLVLQPTRYQEPNTESRTHEEFLVPEIYFIHPIPRIEKVTEFNGTIIFFCKSRQNGKISAENGFCGTAASKWLSRHDHGEGLKHLKWTLKSNFETVCKKIMRKYSDLWRKLKPWNSCTCIE